MKVVLAPRAAASIRAAIDYLKAQDRGAAEAFKADIRACRQLLSEHPRIGSATDIPDVRYVLTVQFRYIAYFTRLPDRIAILDVRHPAQQRLFASPQQ